MSSSEWNGDEVDDVRDGCPDGDEVPRTLHDGMFKSLFSDPALATQELQAVLPAALAARVDWSAMLPMPPSFVDAVFRQRTGDLVYQGRFVDGGEVLFWLLEHQSREDWWMLERLVDTTCMMWRCWRKQHREARRLPVIVPVVIYNGPRPWRAPRDLDALYGLSEATRAALGPHVLSCAMVLDDLAAVEDEALRARRMDAYARLCLFAMARAAERDFLERLAAWQGELKIVFASGDNDLMYTFLVYTSRVHRHTDPDKVQQRIAAPFGFGLPLEGDRVSTLERLVHEGLEKGLQGQRAMLLRLLAKRFGAVPEPIAARVNAAAVPEVDHWFDRALDAGSLDDVFGSE